MRHLNVMVSAMLSHHVVRKPRPCARPWAGVLADSSNKARVSMKELPEHFSLVAEFSGRVIRQLGAETRLLHCGLAESLTHKTMKDISNDCCYKSLGFGVICSAATCNQYTKSI